MIDNNSVRLLLVEDDDNDAYLTQRALRKVNLDWKLTLARDGGSASRLAIDESGVAYDLVITDLKMPRVDGCELIRNLRSDARFSNLPIIVFSSTSEESEIARCYAAGCTDFVQKPAGYDDFMEAVGRIVQGFIIGRSRVASYSLPPYAMGLSRFLL